uniref:ShKT domain-containing protein n=1 Tax=Parastrongyloides trichosuri TaxID=131310 RepID=A0A0N4Z6T8_PARTI
MTKYNIFLIIIFYGFIEFSLEAGVSHDGCHKLAVCALNKCIPSITTYPQSNKLLSVLLEKTNFACILGPMCYEFCNQCSSCKYAQEQMKRIILGMELEGSCKKLENCAQSCIDDGLTDPFKCVFQHRCANYCLDNVDCPKCYDMVKRVFTGYCVRSNFVDHYKKKCKDFFVELSIDFVKTFNKTV